MSSDTPKAPPGCEPIEGGAAYQITDGEAFLDAIRPAVEAGLAHAEDDATERSGDGWSGTITCPACPVQIEGEADGMCFYFRARWDAWMLAATRFAQSTGLPWWVAVRATDPSSSWIWRGDASVYINPPHGVIRGRPWPRPWSLQNTIDVGVQSELALCGGAR